MGSFKGDVHLTALGVPPGVAATFSPASTAGLSTMTLTASNSAAPATTTVTIDAVAGSVSHTATATVMVTPVLTGTVPVDLSSAYNVAGIYNDGSKFAAADSLDNGGYAFSKQQLGSEQVGAGVVFKLGPPNAADAVTSKTVALPPGKFASLKILALAVDGSQELQTFIVNYSDGTSSSFTQSLSDWAAPGGFAGESVAADMTYRLAGDGTQDSNRFYVNAYSFALDGNKTVRSVSLPSNRNVVVFSMTLVPDKL
jgi:hypothetical protein